MLYFKDTLQSIYMFLGGSLIYIFGEPTQFLYILAYMMCLDFITGILKGAYFKELNSTISRNGILKKTGMLVCISAIHILDIFMGSGDVFRNLMVNMFIISELISVLENLSSIGIVVPKYIKKLLKNIK